LIVDEAAFVRNRTLVDAVAAMMPVNNPRIFLLSSWAPDFPEEDPRRPLFHRLWDNHAREGWDRVSVRLA
jgi:hypothetical protein